MITFSKVTHVGRCVFLAVTLVSHGSHPKGAEPQRSPILGFPVFIFTPSGVEIPNSEW